MLIVMKPSATARDVDAVLNVIEAIGLRAHAMPGATRTAIGITGNQGPIDGRRFESLAGVAEVIRVTKPYKLITLDLRPEKTVVSVNGATIGGGELAIQGGVASGTLDLKALQDGMKRSITWDPRFDPANSAGVEKSLRAYYGGEEKLVLTGGDDK